MNRSFFTLIILLFFFSNSVVTAQNVAYKKANKELDAMIEQGMQDWQIPGLAVTVVKGGEVLFEKTYGVKKVGTEDLVDKDTRFAMASTTKAVVAMALGVLVDEGKINWTDRVVDHYPEFQLKDAYLTKEARIQDLLTHNLGLGNADMIWVGGHLSMEETVERMKYAEASYSLRSSFIYQNIMYAAAGVVIEKVAGKNWYEFIKERLLNPLGMNTVGFKEQVEAGTNKVTPHNFYNDKVIPLKITYGDGIGPAGMLWSSIVDMTKYEQFLTSNGIYNGDTLLQRETFDYLFKPQALIPESRFYPTTQLTAPNWTSYGLGWFQHDYKGEKLDFHTGSLPGLVAITGLLRSHDLGVYVFANMDHAELRHAILYKALDLYALGGERDWNKEVYDLYKKFSNVAKRSLEERDSARVVDTNPSKELVDYAGEYTHKMYGTITITVDNDELQFNMNDHIVTGMQHWHYDTFITAYHDPFFLEGELVTFNKDDTGKVSIINFLGMNFTRESE